MLTDAQAFEFLELVGDGFLLVDGEFRVIWMNAHARQISIRPVSELIGRTMWALFPDLRETELGRMLARVMAGGAPESMDVLFTRYGGNQIWLDVRACPAEGGLAIFYRDIGDRKRAEEELKRTQAELIHASRLSAMGTMGATRRTSSPSRSPPPAIISPPAGPSCAGSRPSWPARRARGSSAPASWSSGRPRR